MMALALSTGQPPPPGAVIFAVLLFLVLYPVLTSFSNRLMGIPALYDAYPADPLDPIEENLGWNQVRFGGLRGHSPMSVRFGRRCLHLKQPFPFQAAWWRGPASIPWREITVEKELVPGAWSLLRAATFRLGAGGPIIRVGGKAALRLQARIMREQGHASPSPALRPR
jgi:hypothetical protein